MTKIYQIPLKSRNKKVDVPTGPDYPPKILSRHEILRSLGEEGGSLFRYRFYRFDKPGVQDYPSDFLLPPTGSNLLGVTYTHSELRKLAGSLFEEFGYKLVLNPVEKRMEILKFIDEVAVSFSLDLVSETLIRTLFYFAIIMSNKEAVIALEEPEAHAFPYYVKQLAEMIARDNTNQYFISTHNPYLLISLIEKAPKDDIGVFVTLYEDYQTKVYPLETKKLRAILEEDIDVFFNIEELAKGEL